MVSEEFNIKSGTTSHLEWSLMKLPKKGEPKSGDEYLIKKYRDKVLLGAIDGLGHGKNAAQASKRTKYLLEGFSNESLINLVNNCHANLSSKRGVVMSLALVDSWEKTMTWIGVGNVEGFFLPAKATDGSKPESILLKHGIVGYKLPALHASILPISVGDILIFTTDGIQNGYINEINPDQSLEQIVKYIASNYLKGSDDALILAAKFMGNEFDKNA